MADYKNLSEIAVHKKGLWSELLFPTKHFFLYFTVFNHRHHFFPGTVFVHSVSLFQESSCSHPLFNGYCIYFRIYFSI